MKWRDEARKHLSVMDGLPPWLHVEARGWRWDYTWRAYVEVNGSKIILADPPIDGPPLRTLAAAKLAAEEWVVDQALTMAQDERGLNFRPHSDPKDCPAWHDWCHCTVDTLAHNVQRAERAESEARRLRALLRDVQTFLDGLELDADCGVLTRCTSDHEHATSLREQIARELGARKEDNAP